MEVAQGMIWRKIRAPLFRPLARRQQAHARPRGIRLLQLN